VSPDLIEAFVREMNAEEQWITERIVSDAANWEQILRARGELAAVLRLRGKLQDIYDRHTKGDVWEDADDE